MKTRLMYHSGGIVQTSDDAGRIDLDSEVLVLAKVVEIEEGAYVFRYQVEFADGSRLWVATNQLMPVPDQEEAVANGD